MSNSTRLFYSENIVTLKGIVIIDISAGDVLYFMK